MTWLIILAVASLLIFVNSFYVAAEFSAVSSRRSRLAQLAEDGNRLAQALLPIIETPHDFDKYIATCQLGITISSLLLGFFSQSTVTEALLPLFTRFGAGVAEVAARSVVATAVLLFFTVLQVIFGELVPKNIGIQNPERLALATSAPTRGSMALFRPLIWLFNGSGLLLLKLLGLSTEAGHTHVHSPDEILMLVEESEASGLLDQEERRLLRNTLRLRGALVRQVMIPRTRILAAPVDRPCNELLTLLADSPFSRLPLYEGSLDNIVGVVHLKDLLCLQRLSGQSDVRAVMRPVLFMPETAPVADVFASLQRGRYYVAVVLDEFGGTAGLITLKDLIDEIFGEFQDEFDSLSPPFKLLPGNRLLARGDILVRELNAWLDLMLPTAEVDTLGGLVLSAFGHVPQPGDEVQIEGIHFRVERMDGKGVGAVSFEITADQVRRLKGARP